jgi:pimeloyl-ACP methyl ester carboxylesterase
MPYLKDLYYQAYQAEDPQRKPVVLIHGAGGEGLSWPSQLRRLAGYRVFAPDLPGHGKSRGSGLQRVPAYGQALENWISALELPRFFLVGHSLGGAIALWFALQHPELLSGLVLISTGAQLPVNLSLIENLASPDSYPAAVDDICRWSFSPETPSRIVDSVRKQILSIRSSVLEADFRACDAYDLSSRLGEVSVPSLVLVGEEDKMTPVRFAEGLSEGIPGAELQVVKGAGHMLPLERSDEVAEILRSYFERVLGA